MTDEFKGYLRVTEVLYPFSGLQNLDQEIVANAGRRGTKVHKICEGILEGLGCLGVDDETWGYVESFNQFMAKHPNLKVVALERRFFCEELKITGQIDLICEIDGVMSILDLKTSSKPSKTWPLQGAAYYYLAKKAGFDIKQVIFLHLNKHGKTATMWKYEPDVDLFMAILKVFKCFFMEKISGQRLV